MKVSPVYYTIFQVKKERKHTAVQACFPSSQRMSTVECQNAVQAETLKKKQEDKKPVTSDFLFCCALHIFVKAWIRQWGTIHSG